PHVRVTAGPVQHDGPRLMAARIGVLESAGTAGPVRLEFAAAVTKARICGVSGGMLSAEDSLPTEAEIDGHVVKLHLRRYQWLHLDLEFA
ncbi:MAG: hypothetical protein ACKOWG_05830, partial [Planctomycetia bacterium]